MDNFEVQWPCNLFPLFSNHMTHMIWEIHFSESENYTLQNQRNTQEIVIREIGMKWVNNFEAQWPCNLFAVSAIITYAHQTRTDKLLILFSWFAFSFSTMITNQGQFTSDTVSSILESHHNLLFAQINKSPPPSEIRNRTQLGAINSWTVSHFFRNLAFTS